jgi:CRISPR system Cascade subunit CasE
MFLHRIHLDPRCREARRDLADPYQLHSTLCRAFSEPDKKCPKGEFLWRLEPETGPNGCPQILVQSQTPPVWSRIDTQGWLAKADPSLDLNDKLKLDALKAGQRFRFRLRANPCVKRDGKRLGLLKLEDQEKWIMRKGKQHGFSLPRQLAFFDPLESPKDQIDVRISQEQMLRGRQHTGNGIWIYSVLYDGFLTVTEPEEFRKVLKFGIGHGKVMGLGLLSVVPVS